MEKSIKVKVEKDETSVENNDGWIKKHINYDKTCGTLESYLTIILFTIKVTGAYQFSWHVVWMPLIVATVIRLVLACVECRRLKKAGKYTKSSAVEAMSYINRFLILDIFEAILLTILLLYILGIYRNNGVLITVAIIFILNKASDKLVDNIH